jgi:hypothetical protein
MGMTPMRDNTAACTEALSHLEQLRPNGPWLLTAIIPDGKTTTITAHNADEVRQFIDDHNGKQNLYYSVNPVRRDMRKKTTKEDIAQIEYLFGDLDPKDKESPDAAKARYQVTLETYPLTPTAVIDSGNGLQVLWRLTKPIELTVGTKNKDGRTGLEFLPESKAAIADVESRTKLLMQTLGSVAGTQNIDRLLRLPGTINLPNAVKIGKGRVPCPTSLIKFNGVAHAFESFPKPDVKPDTATTPHKDAPQNEDTAPNIFERFAASMLPDDLKDLIRDGVVVGDRSTQFYHAVGWLKDERWTLDEIITLLLKYPKGIAEKYNGRLRKETKRCYNKARDPEPDPDPDPANPNPTPDPSDQDNTEDDTDTDQTEDAESKRRRYRLQADKVTDEVLKLNKTYALVIVGDKTIIMKDKANKISFLKVTAFEQWLANRLVKSKDRYVPLGKLWMTHRKRRQYEGICFSPGSKPTPAGHFNMWRGFSVEPKQGDCSKFLAHIRDNVCRGDTALCNWVIGWFAQIIQQPDVKMGTSLVLRGKQGTGKTKVGEVVGSLLGVHYQPVADSRYITGRFNSHLVSCLLLHADEAYWAGDHTAEGKLKDLVTSPSQHIEYKGLETILINNYVRLFTTGNPNWLVPAGFDERRHAVLDVGEDKMQDKKYFAAIDAEMDNGGREALLYHLLNFDLTTVDLRTIPKTEALVEQQIASLTSEQSWWLDTLMSGELPWGCDVPNECPANRLFDRYITRATLQGARRKSIETQVGGFLMKHVPELRKSKAYYKRWNRLKDKMVDKRGSVYVFPSLKDCRAAFAGKMGAAIKWDDAEADWETEPPPDATDPNDNIADIRF